MKSNETLVDEYKDNKAELNKRVNYLVRNSPKHKSNTIKGLVTALVLVLFLFGYLIYLGVNRPINYQIIEINTYPQETRIIKEFKFIEPDIAADCIKVQEAGSEEYQMRCIER